MINGRSSSPPASPQMTTTQTVLQNAATGTGNGTALPVQPGDLLTLVTSGASIPSFTVAPEVSFDGGSSYVALASTILGTMNATVTVVIVSTTTVQVTAMVPSGATHVRARISVYVTGTCTVTAHLSRK